MYTISLLNMKGGVGKTTTSVNLAAWISSKKHRTLLVDLDPQANSTSMFVNGSPAYTTSDLMKLSCSLSDAVVKVGKYLSVVPSDLNLANTDTEIRLQTDAPQHTRLNKALDKSNSEYEYCVIDCPPIINILTINAIIASDLIIIPIKPDKFAVQGFSVTIENINKIKNNFDVSPVYRVMFCSVNRNNEEKEIIRQLKEAVTGKCYESIIRNQPKPVTAASTSGEAVVLSKDPRIKVAQDYICLFDEILQSIKANNKG